MYLVIQINEDGKASVESHLSRKVLNGALSGGAYGQPPEILPKKYHEVPVSQWPKGSVFLVKCNILDVKTETNCKLCPSK